MTKRYFILGPFLLFVLILIPVTTINHIWAAPAPHITAPSAPQSSPPLLNNNAPVANNDLYDLHPNTIFSQPAPGILANDTDTENDPFTILTHTLPANGSLTLSPIGAFTFTPTNNYQGTTSFTYVTAHPEANNNMNAYWALDDNTTTATDSSTHGLNGTLTNSPTWTTTTPATTFTNPYALTFDGVDDHVIIPDPSAQVDFLNEDFTIALWVRPAITQTYITDVDNSLIEKWDPAIGYPFTIRYLNRLVPTDRGKIQVVRYDTNNVTYMNSTISINDDQFHHVAFVKTGSVLQLYIDGTLNNTTIDTTNYGATTNTAPIYLGQRFGLSNAFKGTLDDIRIYDRALSSYEINNLAQGNTSLQTSNIATVTLNIFPRVNPLPLPASHTAPTTTTLQMTFRNTLNSSTINNQNIVIHGLNSGSITGTFNGTNPVIFTPNNNFFPGELIHTTVTSQVVDINTNPLTPPYVWEFRTATQPSPATFLYGGSILGTASDRDIAFGDLDQDGDLDVVTMGDYIGTWLNMGGLQGGTTGTFTFNSFIFPSGLSQQIALGDLDGDNDLDIFLAVWGSPNRVLLNNGFGTFSNSGQNIGNSYSSGVDLGDVDGDGDLDALVSNQNQPSLIWLNNGLGTFTNSGNSFAVGYANAAQLGDVDNDGDLDAFIVAANQPNTVWLNNGYGNFSNSGQSLGNANSYGVDLGDIDNDGDLDAFVANYGSYSTVWINNGAGLFTTQINNSSSNAFGIQLGDLDGDGDLDAVIANSYAVNHTLINDGSGNFTIKNLGGSYISDGVDLGDLDNDGDLDIIVANNSSDANEVWLNELYVDLSLAKSVSAINATPGQRITYTLSYINNGPITATNVVITDLIPISNFTSNSLTVSSSGATITPRPNTTYVWDVAPLALGAGGTIIISGILSPTLPPSTFTNYATISNPLRDGNITNNQAAATVSSYPDLTITQQINANLFLPGDTITYTLTYLNQGYHTASDVVITDIFPFPILTNTLTVLSSGAAITPRPATSYIWDVVDLPVGSGGTITITGLLAQPATALSFTNQASISTSTAESNTGNNLASQTGTILNIPPIATDDSYTMGTTDILAVPTPGLLANDSDANGDSFTAVTATNPTNGDLALQLDGSFTFTPTFAFTGITTFSYQATSFDHTATAYWPLDDNNNIAIDNSGNGHDGTLTNSPTWVTTTAPINTPNPYALAFDGTDDHIVIPNNPAFNPAVNDDFTIALWVKIPPTHPGAAYIDESILDKWSGVGGYPYTVRYLNQNNGANSGKIQVVRYDGTNAVILYSTTTVNDNQFHHVAFVKDGPAINLYIDGILESTATDTLISTSGMTNGSPLYIGQRGNGSNQFQGIVDDLHLYSHAISAAGIIELANGNEYYQLANTATVSITVTPVADLALNKQVNTPSASAGDTITYTLTYTNNGPNIATNVVITDQIPLPLSHGSLAVTTAGATITPRPGSPYSWDVADLPMGAGGIITITGIISDPVNAMLLTNSATITATTYDSNPTNNTSTAAITIPVIHTITPPANSHQAPLTTTIEIDFNDPPLLTSITTATITTHGNYHGTLNGTFLPQSDPITFVPDTPFFPGELSYTTITTGVLNSDSTPLNAPYIWGFRTAVTQGDGYFIDSGQTIGLNNNWRYQAGLGDLDHDGDLDLFLGTAQYQPNEVWLNNGDATFTKTNQIFPSNTNSYGIALGDVDLDGDLDVWEARDLSDKLWLNNGDGTFTDSGQSLSGFSSSGVAFGDLDGDGDLDALVTKYSTNYSDEIWFNDGNGIFTLSSQPLTTVETNHVSFGDVDSDGDLDALITSAYARPAQLWLNDGTGFFIQSAQSFNALYSPYAILEDLDNDADLDALVGNQLWLNDGTGTFSYDATLLTGSVFGVQVGDIDGNNSLDLVVAVSNNYQLWLNDGAGNFTPSSQILNNGQLGDAAAVGDLDQDGDLDIFAALDSAPMKVWLNQAVVDLELTQQVEPLTAPAGATITYTLTYTNHGAHPVTGIVISDPIPVSLTHSSLTVTSTGPTITPRPGSPYLWDIATMPAGATGTIVITGILSPSLPLHTTITNTATITATGIDLDPVLNNNSATTVLTITPTYYNITALTPAPNSHTAPLTTTLTITYTEPLTATNINSQTLFVSSSMQGTIVGSASSNGTITFTPSQPFLAGELIQTTIAPNILTTNPAYLGANYVWQFQTQATAGSGYFVDSNQRLLANNYFKDAALGDLDGDGDLDAVVINYSINNTIWWNDGRGIFTNSGQNLGTGITQAAALGDLDHDGDLDIFITYANGEPNQVWMNNGTGIFTNSGQNLTPSNSSDVVLGDLDGDGDLDAFTVGPNTNGNKVWFNNGLGIFTPSGQIMSTTCSLTITLGDVDQDGDLDAIMANIFTFCSASTQVWLNNGHGFFTNSSNTFNNTSIIHTSIGDLDNDGDLDLINTTQNGQQNDVWFNDGTGLFSTLPNHYLGTAHGKQSVLADIDADNDLDAILIMNNNTATIWENDGTGSFTATPQTLPNLSTLTVADLNNNGALDIFGLYQNLYVWYNDIANIDLTLTSQIEPAIARPGDTVTYTLTFANTGPLPATNVVITDLLPINFNPQSFSFTNSGVTIIPRPSTNYIWDIPTIPVNGGGTITITGILNSTNPPQTITNQATIATTSNLIELQWLNNQTTTELNIVHDVPTARDDSYMVAQNLPLTVSAPGILANDGYGGIYTPTLVTPPAAGTLNLQLNGGFVYTPANNYLGSVTFSYYLEPLGPPAIGYWKLDDYNLTITDSSGNGHHGTASANLWSSAHAPTHFTNPFSYYAHPSFNTYISIPDHDALDFGPNDDFTIALWVKPNSYADGASLSDSSLVEKWSAAGGLPYAIRYINNLDPANLGRIQALRYDGTNLPVLTSNSRISSSKYHHIAFVKRGNTLYLYIDGLLDTTAPDTTTGVTTNNSNLYFGVRGNGGNGFTGLLDDIRIYDYGVSSADILTLMGGYHINMPSNTAIVTLNVATPVPAISPTLTTTLTDNDITMTWAPLAANCTFDVYASTDPYTDFTTLTTNLTATTFIHSPGTTRQTSTNTFYFIRAHDCFGLTTADSQTVGEFDYTIIAGQ
ncbi:MAG TPA: FG-GAP-like repeat-containing protein [Anaerolineae bacterium]|nr:FG-GAP-like repeat-containing protein [Anaerolineae bacterium]